MRHPGIKVLAAMAGRGVHEARAGIVSNMIAIEKRHLETVAERGERMSAGERGQIGSGHIAKTLVLQLCLGKGLFRQLVGENKFLAGTRAEIIDGFRDLIEAIGYARGVCDRAIAGDRPGVVVQMTTKAPARCAGP